MASLKFVSRLSSRLQPFVAKPNNTLLSLGHSLLKSSSQSQVPAFTRRISRVSRLPLELSSAQSMMPLHSAIASARLISSLTTESLSWGLVPQGISMPL